MSDSTLGERKKQFLIEDFKAVKSEPHPRGTILTDANGMQILRTEPDYIMINGHYHKVPAQDYILRDEPRNKKIKDVRVTG